MKRAHGNLKVVTSQALRSDDLSADGRIPKKKPEKPFKKNGAGIARVCMHCKNARMPETKYGTHSSYQCRDKEMMMQMASGSFLGDRKTVSDRYKKRYKENKKDLKKAQKRNAKLFKAAKKYMKKIEFKRMAKKLARRSEASINVSDSSSDDDSSVSSDSSSDSE